MKITKHKVVVLTYEAMVDGQIVDKAGEDHPLDYIQGCHMLIPTFEDVLEGKSEGDAFDFEVSPEEGYGKYDPKQRFDIPKTSFAVNGTIREDLLTVGRMIPMLNGNGEVCHARIMEIKENDVTMDFNHPMAGKVLHFIGKVLSVRDASEKELSEGLHGEFLPPQEHHCHCHGHGSEGGCCHGGHHGEGEGCCHGGNHDDGEGCCCHGNGDGESCHCHEKN